MCHSTDLLTARGVAHLVVHGTTGSTSYETIPLVRLETSGGVLSTMDMVVQRRDGPRRLRDDDDDDDNYKVITHTHPFNGPLSGTTQVSRYQKGKTNLDFTEARDSEWQWHKQGHMQVCIALQTDNHASTPPLSFLQAGCPSCHPTNSVKALKGSLQSYQFSKNSPDFWHALCMCSIRYLN